MKNQIITAGSNLSQVKTKSFRRTDIVLNIGLKAGFVRVTFALLIPFLLMILPPVFIWLVSITATYLFATGLVHFCPLKYFMMNIIMGRPVSKVCDLAKDLNVPPDEL